MYSFSETGRQLRAAAVASKTGQLSLPIPQESFEENIPCSQALAWKQGSLKLCFDVQQTLADQCRSKAKSWKQSFLSVRSQAGARERVDEWCRVLPNEAIHIE